MLVEIRQNATTVPSAAVQRGAQGIYVYVVKPDNTVTLRKIKVGPVEGDATVIESGVEPGEPVVVDGTDRLREGAKVEPTSRDPAAASKGGDGTRKKGGGRHKGGDQGSGDKGAPADKGAGDKGAAADKGASDKGDGDKAGGDKDGGKKRGGKRGEKAAE